MEATSTTCAKKTLKCISMLCSLRSLTECIIPPLKHWLPISEAKSSVSLYSCISYSLTSLVHGSWKSLLKFYALEALHSSSLSHSCLVNLSKNLSGIKKILVLPFIDIFNVLDSLEWKLSRSNLIFIPNY